MRIGVLTGGGDCPGLNQALRAVVMRGMDHGFELIGIKRGWDGLIKVDTVPLRLEDVEDLVDKGGTMLESSRTNPFKNEVDCQKTLDNIENLKLDCLCALGGEDTLGVASKLHDLGVKTVGIPKTMDNDIDETDYTFGYDSAAQVATEACDRLRDTARSHRRLMVLEVMGRSAGWVALASGVAGGADWILIPEVSLDLEEMCEHLTRVYERGKHWGLVVVSEGVEIPSADEESVGRDAFGHVILRKRGVGEFISREVEQRTPFEETRLSVLGHIIRGGSPTSFDRFLATRLGLKAMDLVKQGEFGKMSSIQCNQITSVWLRDAVHELKRVPVELYNEIKALFK